MAHYKFYIILYCIVLYFIRHFSSTKTGNSNNCVLLVALMKTRRVCL